MTIAQRMIPELKREADMTRRLIASIPADKWDFSPGGGLHTLGWNASHLADIAGWVPMTVNEPGLDLARFDKSQMPPPPTDAAAAIARFDANLAKSLAALEGVPDATMDEPWTMSMNGQPLFTIPKGDCLRKWIFTHTAHHRGILSASLRLAGVAHASIYES